MFVLDFLLEHEHDLNNEVGEVGFAEIRLHRTGFKAGHIQHRADEYTKTLYLL